MFPFSIGHMSSSRGVQLDTFYIATSIDKFPNVRTEQNNTDKLKMGYSQPHLLTAFRTDLLTYFTIQLLLSYSQNVLMTFICIYANLGGQI